MKIKNKLRLGFGFLFMVLIFFAGFSLYYLKQISNSAEVILKDNYESLEFSKAMRKILDETDNNLSPAQVRHFEIQLEREEHNLTEKGEAEEAANLRRQFEVFKNPALSPNKRLQAEKNIRLSLHQIEDVNMQAIVRKNEQTKESVKEASAFLGIIGSIAFLIVFTFSVNFPGFIVNPINEVVEGIKEISQKNYQARLEFKSNDEFEPAAKAFNQMASRLNEWEHSNLADVIAEKSRIETLIKQMQDAVIGLNEKGRFIFLNPAAEQLLNLSEKKIKDTEAAKIADSNDLLKNILTKSSDEEPIKIFADNKESYFLVENHKIAIPAVLIGGDREEIPNAEERPVGEVFILRNITRFRELDEAKTNFIATISHELKTPIASIKMSLKLLADHRIGHLNAEQSGLIDHIEEDSGRLLKITSELLDLSQVETGNIQLNFTSAEPKDIVEYAISAIKLSAEEKKIQLQLEIEDNLPRVSADLEKTAWVLINFLSNAIRYSSEGSKINITIRKGNGTVTFSVQDFGRGIEPQYAVRLFERYFQVPTDGKNKSGSGLGLSISKDFIEAQKGKIFVQSELGAGSVFGFMLPVG